MAFLAYRFIPATLIVAVDLPPAATRALQREGWRAGLVMGVFLTRRLHLPDARPRGDERLQRRLHHRPVRRAHPGAGRRLPAAADPRAGLDRRGRVDVRALAAVGGRRRLQPARRRVRVDLRLLARGSHPRDGGAPSSASTSARCSRCSWGWWASPASRSRRSPDSSSRPRARQSGPPSSSRRSLRARSASSSRRSPSSTRPPARTALILASEPAFAGLFGWLLNDERLSVTGWLGAALIIVGDPGGRGSAAVSAAPSAAGGMTGAARVPVAARSPTARRGAWLVVLLPCWRSPS